MLQLPPYYQMQPVYYNQIRVLRYIRQFNEYLLRVLRRVRRSTQLLSLGKRKDDTRQLGPMTRRYKVPAGFGDYSRSVELD